MIHIQNAFTPASSERANQLETLYHRFSPEGVGRMRRRVMAVRFAHLILGLLPDAKRLTDLFLASLLILLCSPFWLCLMLIGARWRRTTKIGRFCMPYQEYSFAFTNSAVGRLATRLHLDRLPTLLNVLKGDLSIIGPRAASPGELSVRDRAVRKRSELRPGLISLWWLRRRGNVAYESELAIDLEYMETQSVVGDLGIALRALPAMFYGETGTAGSDHIDLLGIPIDNMTMDDAIEKILHKLEGKHASQVCFVNADCANLAYKNSGYLRTLQTSDMVLADGIGMKLAGKLLRKEIRQNVNGTDMFPRLCEALEHTGKGIYLLGARPGVAEDVQSWVEAHYPGTVISGTHSGYFSADEEADVVRQIAESGAGILLVALGAPRQDLWLKDHLEACGVQVGIGVGGLFDFYSGRIPRAPQWMREIGMEWLFRFLQEPGRLWKRYIVGNALFLFRVGKERVTSSHQPQIEAQVFDRQHPATR